MCNLIYTRQALRGLLLNSKSCISIFAQTDKSSSSNTHAFYVLFINIGDIKSPIIRGRHFTVNNILFKE